MFTGIIRELGAISDADRMGDGIILTLSRPASFVNLTEGDSVAVNGACLTVLARDQETWQARLMRETVEKTNLGMLAKGMKVNLERPIAAGDRFDGHFVQGHVDGCAAIVELTPAGEDRLVRFCPPRMLLPYFIAKGSVALNGVSLTIVDVYHDSCTVSLMPYTLQHTTFGVAQVGEQINVEVDMLAKYMARLLSRST